MDYYNDEYWILGDAFMRGFYTIHEMENARQGFIPLAGYDGIVKPDPVAVTTLPSVALPSVGLSMAAWIGIGVGTAAVIGVVVWLIIAFVAFFLRAFKGSAPAKKQVLEQKTDLDTTVQNLLATAKQQENIQIVML